MLDTEHVSKILLSDDEESAFNAIPETSSDNLSEDFNDESHSDHSKSSVFYLYDHLTWIEHKAHQVTGSYNQSTATLTEASLKVLSNGQALSSHNGDSSP